MTARPSVVWRPSPNFGYNLLFLPVAGSTGRGGRPVTAIVNHLSQSYESGLNAKFLTPRGVSAHFAVLQDGRIIQYVDEADAAYHVPAVNPVERYPWLPADSLGRYGVTVVNQMTIGIEHEGFSGRPPTDQQLAASIALHRYLAHQYHLPADASHIVGHGQLDRMQRTACPGSHFPLDRIIAALQEEVLEVA